MKHNQCLFIILSFFIAPLTYTMESKKQLAMLPKQVITVKQFFDEVYPLCILKATIDTIEKKQLTYEDYAQRKGIIWSDFFVNTEKPEKIKECNNTIKLTLVGDKLEKHNPQSLFDYPDVKKILCHSILPKTFAYITAQKWAKLPKKVFAQFFLQRCHTSEAMDWHQDPGEDYDTMADFSLVLMLSEQNDLTHGWHGGEFKIRAGLPTDTYNEIDVTTIIPEYNQAILFNNKINSHSITTVSSTVAKTQRDLLVVPIYLDKLPMPVQ